MLSSISVYLIISKLILLFSYSFFMHHALHFPTFIFTLYVCPCFPFFLTNHNWKRVLLIIWVIFFWSSKIFFCSFQLFENGHIHDVVSTLINIAKIYVENNNIVSTLSNVVTLFSVANFNVDIRSVVSKLIWHYPMSQHHITLTTTLRQRWSFCWVLKNVTKRLHNFEKLYQIENIHIKQSTS